MDNDLNTEDKKESNDLESLPNDNSGKSKQELALEKLVVFFKKSKEFLLDLLDLKNIEGNIPEQWREKLPENRRLVTLPIFILVVGFVLIFLLALFAPSAGKKTTEKYVPVVRVMEAKKESVHIPVFSQGLVSPKNEIKLVSLVNGPVIFVSPNFVDGGYVTKDELLLEISDRSYQQDKARVEANLARAKAGQVAKQSELRVRGTLRTEAGVSQLREVNAAVKAAEADVEKVDDLIADTKFKAPFTGLIRQTNIRVGQLISAGTPVASIFSTDKAIVSLPLSERQLNFISLPEVSMHENLNLKNTLDEQKKDLMREFENRAKLPLVKIIGDFDGKNYSWEGRLVRSAGGRNELNRLQYVTVEIDNPYGKDEKQPNRPPLSPGFFVQAEIEGQELKDIIKLPRKALKLNQKIWGVNSQNLLQSFDVELIHRGKDFVYVSSGIEDGASILISDLEILADGIEVKGVALEGSTKAPNDKPIEVKVDEAKVGEQKIKETSGESIKEEEVK